MQRDHLAIDHYIDRTIEMKINATDFTDLGQRVPRMGAVVQARQVADQTHTPNWSPADVLDQSVVGRRKRARQIKIDV
jgi:hypothetical protein